MPAITIGPDVEVPERGQGERLISAGGNIYSLALMVPKSGLATRGRGFWAGRERADCDNPDIDNPSPQGAQILIEREAEEGEPDGFDDDVDPMLAMRASSHITAITQAQTKAAKKMVDAVLGLPVKKSILTLGDVKVDLLLSDPKVLTEEQLVQNASTLKSLMSQTHDNYEKAALRDYAARLQKALSDVLKAKEVLAKAMPKSTADKDAEEQEKRASKPPKKSQETIADDKGRTQHKYPKKGDGKGIHSDGRKPEDMAHKVNKDQDETHHGKVDTKYEPQEISPPPQIDPAPFAQMLKIPPAHLEKLAQRMTRDQFIRFWMKDHKELVRKQGLVPEFIGRLFDSLMGPAAPPAQQQEQQGQQAPDPGNPQAQQQMPPMPAAKSTVVVFNGGTLDQGTLKLLTLLKSHQAETIADIQDCIQAHYACTPDMASRTTCTLLNRMERQGLVKFYPKGSV